MNKPKNVIQITAVQASIGTRLFAIDGNGVVWLWENGAWTIIS